MRTWTTKEWKIIPIDKLKDSHLLNIKKFLERKSQEGVAVYYKLWLWENDYNEGEMDILYDEDALDYLWYEDILKEIRKRNLQK